MFVSFLVLNLDVIFIMSNKLIAIKSSLTFPTLLHSVTTVTHPMMSLTNAKYIHPFDKDAHVATDLALDSPDLVTLATTEEQSNLTDSLHSIEPKPVWRSKHAKYQLKYCQVYVLNTRINSFEKRIPHVPHIFCSCRELEIFDQKPK